MHTLWMGLIGISLLSGAVGMLVPRVHRGHVRLLTGLCVLCLIGGGLASLSEGASLFGEEWRSEELYENYDEIYNETLQKADTSYLEEILTSHILQSFSADREELSLAVELTTEDDEMKVKKTTVVLRDKAHALDPHALIDELVRLTDAPCTVIYE